MRFEEIVTELAAAIGYFDRAERMGSFWGPIKAAQFLDNPAYEPYREQALAKAGLTGYAQVYGKANTSPYDKLQMDLMYIGEQSVITDLKIIFATIKILFMPESTEGFAEEKDALGTDEVTDSMQ